MQHTTAVRPTTRALEFEAYCERCSWVERVATRGEAVSVKERALDLAQEHYERETEADRLLALPEWEVYTPAEDDKPYSGTAPIERGPFPALPW